MASPGRPKRMDQLAQSRIDISINLALQALNAHGNVKDAAAQLEMSPTTLRDFMAQHGIIRREAVAYVIAQGEMQS